MRSRSVADADSSCVVSEEHCFLKATSSFWQVWTVAVAAWAFDTADSFIWVNADIALLMSFANDIPAMMLITAFATVEKFALIQPSNSFSDSTKLVDTPFCSSHIFSFIVSSWLSSSAAASDHASIERSYISAVAPCEFFRPSSFSFIPSMLFSKAMTCGETLRPKTSASLSAESAASIMPDAFNFSRVFVRPSAFIVCWLMFMPNSLNTFCC